MQGLYTGCAEDVQVPDERTFGTANILSDSVLGAEIIDSPNYERRSTSAWQAKLNAAPDPKIAYHGIIEEWRTGCYAADIAVRWLQAYRLLTAPYTGDPYELMCRAAYDEFGPVALPEPSTAPVPSVSSREPFAPADREAM